MKHFVVVGINYKNADIIVREKLYFSNNNIEEALVKLKSYNSIYGAVILSTCNRVEIYASVDDINNGFRDIINFLNSYHNINNEDIIKLLYKIHCNQAIIHLYKVISGIDSMVLGEHEIQGQVRNAYNIANAVNLTDNYLNKIFQSAINTGKRVRSETEIAKGSISVASMAVELINSIFEDTEKLNVLIIGAGKIAELTAQNIKDRNYDLTITNRSLDKAKVLAQKLNCNSTSYEERYNEIIKNDIIIVATSSNDFTLEFSEIKAITEKFNNNTKLFIDLSVPRNINPKINEINNCIVFSIDDINKKIDINLKKRNEEVVNACKIVDEESQCYFNWYHKQSIIPTMYQIKDKLNILKERTISDYKNEFGEITDNQKKIIEEMLDSYSDKLIKVIMKNIKEVADKNDMIRIVETLKKSFSIEKSIKDVLNDK